MTSSSPELQIGGLTPLSTCDWPGELTATVFCQGCPWGCRYCHNGHLQGPAQGGTIAWPDAMDLFRRRRGLLDGVVFSGGEPTLQSALPAAIRDVRTLGLRVGLHTAGPYPDRLEAVAKLVDWIGFDVKTPFAAYERVTGVPGSGDRARESLKRVLSSGADYEVRTTVHPVLLDETMIQDLVADLAGMGVRHYVIQQFRSAGCDDPVLNAAASTLCLPRHVSQSFETFATR